MMKQQTMLESADGLTQQLAMPWQNHVLRVQT